MIELQVGGLEHLLLFHIYIYRESSSQLTTCSQAPDAVGPARTLLTSSSQARDMRCEKSWYPIVGLVYSSNKLGFMVEY